LRVKFIFQGSHCKGIWSSYNLNTLLQAPSWTLVSIDSRCSKLSGDVFTWKVVSLVSGEESGLYLTSQTLHISDTSSNGQVGDVECPNQKLSRRVFFVHLKMHTLHQRAHTYVTSFPYLSLEASGMKFCIQARVCTDKMNFTVNFCLVCACIEKADGHAHLYGLKRFVSLLIPSLTRFACSYR